MPNISYGSGFLKKDFTCVEIALPYAQTGAFAPSGPSAVTGIYTNAITETINASISVGAGGSVASGGLNFTLSGASASYTVTVSFNRKFSGSIIFSGTSIDNSTAAGVDKFCNASIGNPDIIPTDGEIVSNCFQAIFGSNPVTPKAFGWSEVNELTSFTFTLQRINPGSTVVLSLALTEKSFQKWQKNNDVTPVVYTDPLTSIQYTTLPNGVLEVNCEENNQIASYSKELCYKIGSSISFDYSANPAEAWDAYNGVRPRVDGIPPLPFAIGGFNFNEFSPDGKYLYSVSGASFSTHTYSGFTLLGVLSIVINFAGFPAAAAMTPVGLAVHPTTGVIYLSYIDGSRRLWLATLSLNGSLQLVGDMQFNSVVTVPIDAHDITFTASGQLLLAHGSNLYLVDHLTGVLNSGVPIAITGASTNSFAIRNISRYANGDLHLAGQDTGLGPIVIIYDGESYTKIRHWATNNSTTPPDSNISTAYPINPEVRFNRLFIKNIETNQRTSDDLDIVTGQPIVIPQNATIKDCASTVSKITSWTDDLCYVIDKNVLSQGIIQVAPTGQIVSTACNPVGGFVPPAPLVYSSITHNLTGDRLYALDAAGTAFVTYNWATISAPALLSSTAMTGLVSVTENEKSLRTRWSDGTIWLMTEEVVASNRFYRFYIVNTATAALTLQGTVTYPAGGFNNGHMAWTTEDNLVFSYNIGGGAYRVSKLSKINFELQTFVFDANYVIDNINIDLPSQRFLVTKSGATGIDVYSYSGQYLSTCAGGTPYQDALHAPFGQFKVGDTTQRIKKVFIKDLVTGDVTSYYHDYVTGEDIVLPPLARIVSCDNSIVAVSAAVPRFRVFTGISSWSRNIDAPDAKSITLIRVAGTVTVNDGISGAQAIAAAATVTFTADKLGGNLTITGVAGTTYYLYWI